MKKSLIVLVVVLLAVVGWYYVKTETPKPEPVYVKEVHLSSSSASKLPPSIHPLIYRFLFGKDLEIQKAELSPVSTGPQTSVVEFIVSDVPSALHAEYMDYLTNVGWTVRGPQAGPIQGVYTISAGRMPENIIITISPQNGGSSVTISYVPPPKSQ